MDKEETVKYKGKEYPVNYLHEPRNGERGEVTVCYIDVDYGKQLIGLAERSDKDRYDTKLAKFVSKGRLLKKIKDRDKK